MATGFGTYEEEDRVRRLSALQASMPQFKSMQAGGLKTFGEMAGLDTSAIANYKGIQDKALQGFQYKQPGRLLKSENKVEWWKERAALNSMNTIVPMMGFAVGNLMKAIPHPIAKVMGSAVNWATMATAYNMNFADTLEEHQQAAGRELTMAEKQKAALVSIGVTALDVIAPIKGANATSKLLTKSFGAGGVNTAKKSLQKLVNTNRDSLIKQVGTGVGFAGKLIGTEMATEAGQKAAQIGTSVTPGRLGTTEGMQDMFEEAIIAGPTVGAIGAPGAVGQALSTNRDLSTARRLAKDFNSKQVSLEPEDSTKEIDPDKLITIPEGKGYTPEVKRLVKQGDAMLEKYSGVSIEKAAKKLASGTAFKGTHPLREVRDRAKTGAQYHAANKILQMFSPTETGSGEQGSRENFFNQKEAKTGEYLKDVVNIINKYANHKPGIGLIGKTFDAELGNYILAKLSPKKKGVFPIPASFAGRQFEIDADIAIIRKKLDKAHADLNAAGVNVAYVKDYLTNPVSKESIKANREGFVESLIESSKRAYAKASKLGPTKVRVIKPKEAEGIADSIINGYDESVRVDRDSDTGRSGTGRSNFEKSRSAAWEFLDEVSQEKGHGSFRESSVEKVLTGYLQQAATRVASARSFGKDASKLKQQLYNLKKNGDITQREVDRAYDLYDSAHNLYKKDADKTALAASKFATTVGAITHLGLATISSITELAWIGERAGFGHMLITLPKALKYSLDGIKRGASGKYIQPGESAVAMATLGFNLDPRVNERLDQIFSTDQNAILSMYFRTPLGGMLTQWTNFNRNWAAQAMMSNINHRANSLIAGDISDIERRRLDSELKENGLTMDDFNLISRAFMVDGKVKVDITRDDILDTVIKKETRLVAPANKKKKKEEDIRTEDVTVRDMLVPWIHKVVDDVVVHPKTNNKPLWMSDPRFAIIAQLKTFPVVFGNTVVKRLLKKLNPKQCSPDYGAAIGAIGGIAMAYGLVHIGQMMKAGIRGNDYEAPGIRETLDRAGLTAVPGMVGGAGKFEQGAVTALGGTALGFIDRAYKEMITPLYTADEGGLEDADITENLVEWLGESLDSALGATGIYFKPTQNLFGVDE
jgi:hypothetical protein